MTRGQLFLMLKWHLGMTSEEIAEATGRSRRTAEGWSGNTPGKEAPQDVIDTLIGLLDRKVEKGKKVVEDLRQWNEMQKL